MFHLIDSRTRIFAALAGLAALSGCAASAPPPPPPQIVPVAVTIPPRPTPPGGAPHNMVVPPSGPDGLRRSVNYGLSTSQKVWNLRSALNVAALNCRDPRYTGIQAAYGRMLERNKQTLSGVYRRVLGEHRERHGKKDHLPAYDAYMTKVYNYFALPPAKREFCEVANEIANESLLIEGRTAMEPFADSALARIEQVFHDFYTRFEQYHVDVAEWDAQYASPSGNTYNASGTVTRTYGPVNPNVPGNTGVQSVEAPTSSGSAGIGSDFLTTPQPSTGATGDPSATTAPDDGN